MAALLSAHAAGARSQITELPEAGDLEHDLSKYDRYAWHPNQTVPTENVANHVRIINAIQEQMKELGYRLDPKNPEVRIQYRVEVRQQVEGTSSQQRSVWDDASTTVKINFNTEKRAHFKIQLVEAETNFFLWQAEGTYPAGTPDRAEALIRAAVEDLFEQYPTPE